MPKFNQYDNGGINKYSILHVGMMVRPLTISQSMFGSQ